MREEPSATGIIAVVNREFPGSSRSGEYASKEVSSGAQARSLQDRLIRGETHGTYRWFKIASCLRDDVN